MLRRYPNARTLHYYPDGRTQVEYEWNLPWPASWESESLMRVLFNHSIPMHNPYPLPERKELNTTMVNLDGICCHQRLRAESWQSYLSALRNTLTEIGKKELTSVEYSLPPCDIYGVGGRAIQLIPKPDSPTLITPRVA